MKGLIILSFSNYDHVDSGTSSDNDQDPPPTVNSYSCVGDPKGKGPAKKW